MADKSKKEKFTTTGDIIHGAANVLGNGRGTLILAIVGVALSTSSAFMFCLVGVGFDFSQLTTSLFWSRWASMCLATLSSYFFVLLHKDEKNKLNPWYQQKVRLLLDLSVETGADFDSYLFHYNRERKIAWFKNRVNGKIAKLNAKITWRKLKGKPTDDLESKIAIYRACLSEKYIAENENSLKTRSKPIRSAQVLTEAQKAGRDEENFKSAGAYYGVKSIAKIALSLMVTIAFASVILQNLGSGSVASIAMTIFTLLSTVISIFSAILAANGCYKTVYVPNLLFKIKILKGYREWANLSTAAIQPDETEKTGKTVESDTEKDGRENNKNAPGDGGV